MRNITKGEPPASLVEHRAQEHASYGNYLKKDTLRECLVREQRGICCYCMGQIAPTEEAMKIEHWRAQRDPNYSHLQLVYSNLLGACLGGDGQQDAERHCDTAKGMLCSHAIPPTQPITRKPWFTSTQQGRSRRRMRPSTTS
jgi:uncharacterized protein (TIGR02646 family)